MRNSKPTDKPNGNKRAGEGRFFYGYIIAVAGSLIMIISGGAQFSFGVFFKPLLTDFGWTRSVTAGAYSAYWIFYAFFSIFIGRLSDRYSPRLVITVCGLVASLSYFLTSQINSVWQIYLLYGILLSFGNAGIFVILLSTIARWFIANRGLASGVIVAGAGIGMITFPPLASFLISNFSWRISYIAIAALTFLIPLIFAHFLKRAPGFPVQSTDSMDEPANNNPSLRVEGYSLNQAIHTSQLWIICGALFVAGLCAQSVMTHIVAYATDVGIPATISATVLSAVGIVSTISKVGGGIALDRFRSKRMFIILASIMSVSFLLLQLSAELWLLYLFALVFAAGYGGFATAPSPTVAEYFGLRAHGAILGIAMFALAVGCAMGPYIAGLIFDTTGSYNLAFWGLAVLCMAAIILSISLKPLDRNPAERR